jgi:GNAT superfamily N-acetyltransferase
MGIPPSLSYETHDEPDYFYVFVKVGIERVGELLAIKVGDDRAQLSDIKVARDWKRLRKWRERLTKEPFRKFDSISLQNLGIGTDLLRRLLEWCARNGIVEVHGSVVESDLRETPRLLEWYEKRGFVACSPSSDCLPIAVSMVVWKVSSKPD